MCTLRAGHLGRAGFMLEDLLLHVLGISLFLTGGWIFLPLAPLLDVLAVCTAICTIVKGRFSRKHVMKRLPVQDFDMEFGLSCQGQCPCPCSERGFLRERRGGSFVSWKTLCANSLTFSTTAALIANLSCGLQWPTS